MNNALLLSLVIMGNFSDPSPPTWRQVEPLLDDAFKRSVAAVRQRTTKLNSFLQANGSLDERQLAEAINGTIADAFADMEAIDNDAAQGIASVLGQRPRITLAEPSGAGEAMACDILGVHRAAGNPSLVRSLAIDGDPAWTPCYGLMVMVEASHPDPAARGDARRALRTLRGGVNLGVWRVLMGGCREAAKARLASAYALAGGVGDPPSVAEVDFGVLPPASRITAQAKDINRAVNAIRERKRRLGQPSAFF